MSTTTDKEYAHLGQTRGMEDHDHELIDDHQLELSELSGTDVFHRNQRRCQTASYRNMASRVGQVSVCRPRVLQVLVVDDGRGTSGRLAMLVRQWGHDAHAVHDRVAALRWAAAKHPDVVLLDVGIPLLDGCQVVRPLRLKATSQDCLIVAITRQADDERHRQCSEAGIDLVFLEPVDPTIIETLLLLECVRVNRRRGTARGQLVLEPS